MRGLVLQTSRKVRPAGSKCTALCSLLPMCSQWHTKGG